MVLIPAGEFQMGDMLNEGHADERPVHKVYLDAFYIDRYEVTNAQYRRFVQATGHREPEGYGYVDGEWKEGFRPWLVGYGYVDGEWKEGFKPWSDENFNGDDQPVVCVSWEDAEAYAEWADKRLPTEAEWEKAARGGLVGMSYPWGDKITGENANYGKSINEGMTTPVGSYPPNGYGLYDMTGNAWEWCADWYGSGYYRDSPGENPTGPNSGKLRVFRGGSWLNSPYELRVANRNVIGPTYSYTFIGFRCVSQD